MGDLPVCRLCGVPPLETGTVDDVLAKLPLDAKHPDTECPLAKMTFKHEAWRTLMGQGEAVAEPYGYLFFKVGCRAPDDCEEYEEFIKAESVDSGELARYQKHDAVMPLYTTPQPAVDDAVLRDAARYRWLCAEIENGAVEGVSGALVELYDESMYDNGDELSAAIDAAIEKERTNENAG